MNDEAEKLRSRLDSYRKIDQAILQAISAIQKRYGKKEKGLLSIKQPSSDSGMLSVENGTSPEGDLSLDEPDNQQ